MLVSQLDLLDPPTHRAPSARAARPTSPSSGTDKEPNSSSFGGKLLPFLIELNLLGINSLLLRKGCHSGHPSPLQAVGPTLDFYKQFSATPHRVTGRKDRSLVLLLSMLCMVTNVHCSELRHKLLQSQDMHSPCVIGQKCSGSMVSEYHRASTC